MDPRNSPASATPASDGKNLYVFFPDYGLLSYGHDGHERWRLPLGPFHNTYGMGASPVVAGDNVVLQCDQSLGSFIVAVGKDDGRVRWRHDRPEALSGHSTPTLWERRPGEIEVLASSSFRMDAYSARTGELVWFTRGLASELKSLAIVDRDTVYINGYSMPENEPGNQVKLPPFDEMLARHDANRDGRLSSEELPDQKLRSYLVFFDLNGDGLLDSGDWRVFSASLTAENGLLALRPGDARGDVTGRALRWSYRRAIPQLPSLLLYSGVLFMVNDSGVLTTLDPETGKVHKQARIRGVPDRYYASPVGSDGKIFFVSLSGTVTVMAAGPEQTVLAKTELEDEVYATPAISKGRILIRSKSALWCFGSARQAASLKTALR